MTDTTPADLDAIRARADAATPGPWESNANHVYMGGGCQARIAPTGEPAVIMGHWSNAADPVFVAAARTDVEALVREVERLRQELAEKRELVDYLTAELEREHAAVHQAQAELERLRTRVHESDYDGLRALVAEATRRHGDEMEAAGKPRWWGLSEYGRTTAAAILAERDAALTAMERAIEERDRMERVAAAKTAAELERNHLRAVVEKIWELHTDSIAGVCPSCARLGDQSDTDDGLVPWPCPTILAIEPDADIKYLPKLGGGHD